jgi:hypothetical protein
MPTTVLSKIINYSVLTQRLLGNEQHQKSRFVDSNSGPGLAQTSQPNGRNGGVINSNFTGGAHNAGSNITEPNLIDSQFLNGSGYQNGTLAGGQHGSSLGGGAGGNQLNVQSEHNQVFEKILSEVIHVSTFDQRPAGGGGYMGNDMMINQVQEMPFKMRSGLQDAQLNKQQFTLPDGVPAPLAVLSVQPPFLDDIRLINSVAFEANNCINNYSLTVPENVAFDFKPVNM